MDDADGESEFSDDMLDRMVRELHPEWSLRGAAPAEEGTDVVYFLAVRTPEGSRECVLKACEFLDPEAFRPEPYLLVALDRRTSVPVPRTLGAVDRHESLSAPYFLMERRAGEVRENEARDLPADAIERVAREAGRNLGELHDLGDFERFGPVRLARDVEDGEVDRGREADDGEVARDRSESRDSPGLSVDSRTLTVGDTGRDSWRPRFEEFVEFTFENLDARFADLEAPMRSFVADRLDALDRSFPAVLGHDDYRLGNLLVDPATGETRVVLDWGNANTLEAQYNLVLTEQYLSGWALHDDPLRVRVRAALREGYRETGGGTREAGGSTRGAGDGIDRDPDFERRRELYLGATRLFPLAWFSLWYGDFPEAEREEIAATHRRAARELID